MTKQSTIAGPACSAAAWPVITKMPPPITAPMPSAVRPHGPSVRLSDGPSIASASEKSVFLTRSRCSMRIPRCASSRPKGTKPADRSAGFVVRLALRAAQLAAPVAVEEIDEQARDDPAGHPEPVVLERDREQREAADRAEHADDGRGRY